MENLRDNPYLDRPVQNRYRVETVVIKPAAPTLRKARRKLKPAPEPTEEKFYNTAWERRAADIEF